MREDNETLLRRLINGAASVLSGKTAVQIRCVDCGEWKREGDSSPCGSHLPLPDQHEDTFLVRIGFVKPKPALEEPPKVERLGRQSDGRQVSNRYKDPTKQDPVGRQARGGPNLSNHASDSHKGLQRERGLELTAQRVEPRRRTDGGKSRADYRGLSGNPDAFTHRMVNHLPDYEPERSRSEIDKWDDIPDEIPHYGLEER